ncbi:MAG: hypothetical protein CM15mP128_3490 [Methanobacteriota archaeon]|nr:MAG: hypothetical protein CM15mP128_3490 [Euryarchaeota archaeon]
METSAGDILLTLYHGNPPDTVANFAKLVSEGYSTAFTSTASLRTSC